MATAIPALRTCASRMITCEPQLVERVEPRQDGYLLWYDVPMGLYNT